MPFRNHNRVLEKTGSSFGKNMTVFLKKDSRVSIKTQLSFSENTGVFFQEHDCLFSKTQLCFSESLISAVSGFVGASVGRKT